MSATGTSLIRAEIVRACRLLLAAFHYSCRARLDRWQFAVEFGDLRQRGFVTTDLRWLIAEGFAEHRLEITGPGDPHRSFCSLSATAFPQSTAVILSEQGARYLGTMLPPERCALTHGRRDVAQSMTTGSFNDADCIDKAAKPVWDKLRRELRFGGRVVKRFRVPAPNQEIVLQVFQEEEWPHCIDDPLPPKSPTVGKERMLATIKSLNRHQLEPAILFHGNGNGIQIYWEPLTTPTQ